MDNPKGFGELPCLKCGQTGTIRLDLDDLSTFSCPECDDTFCLDDVQEIIGKWGAVVRWLKEGVRP